MIAARDFDFARSLLEELEELCEDACKTAYKHAIRLPPADPAKWPLTQGDDFQGGNR